MMPMNKLWKSLKAGVEMALPSLHEKLTPPESDLEPQKTSASTLGVETSTPVPEKASTNASLSEAKLQALSEATLLYRNQLALALTQKASPRKAIQSYCLQCMGYFRDEITSCTAEGCALWEYRPYQDKKSPERTGLRRERVKNSHRS